MSTTNCELEGLGQKTLEVLGWIHAANCPGAPGYDCIWFMPDGTLTTRPAIESDDGIALDELVKFCPKHGWPIINIDISLQRAKEFQVRVLLMKPDGQPVSDEVTTYDETISGAACKALIEAAKKVK